LIIIAGGKLLHNGPNPYKIGEDNQPDLPFRKVDCIKRVGMFFGKTVVERLIPLQRRYNALRNRKAEFLNRCSIGQWIVEDGACDIDELEQNAGSPSYILVYQRGFSVPKLAENPQLPVAFETELSAILQEISMISGVSELSRQSSADPGVKSGVALSIALEQDDTRLSSSSTNIERFLVSSGKQWLRMYRTMAQGTRLLRSVGSNNLVEIMDWEASELRSDDVVVEGWSALAESPAQRRQMVFDLLAAGLLNDPDTGRIDKDTRAKVFEMIEMGTWETGDDDESLHISKAERENIKLRGGMLENVENYDDHVIHIAKHNSFRLTVDYENLVNENPIIEQIFQAHVDMHLQALALIAQQQMQAAVQMTPQPPEKQTA
jgi:hypothetical protein